jgi:hypothetical protein
MITFFYIFSLLFIWVEWSQFYKQPLLYGRQDVNNARNIKFFLVSKMLNLIMVPIGLFTPLGHLYAIIVSIELSKFLVLMTKNSKFINIYNLISVFIYILTYFTIFIQGVVL